MDVRKGIGGPFWAHQPPARERRSSESFGPAPFLKEQMIPHRDEEPWAVPRIAPWLCGFPCRSRQRRDCSSRSIGHLIALVRDVRAHGREPGFPFQIQCRSPAASVSGLPHRRTGAWSCDQWREIWVNILQPPRFALQKLSVSRERPVTGHARLLQWQPMSTVVFSRRCGRFF
jgi:hypothetical protein